MARLRTSRLASLGVLLSVCLVGTALAQERFTRQVSFDIAAQSVEAALLEFSKQADVQVMVGTTSLNGQKTEGVKGTLSVKDALQQLLRNTGLEYQTEGNSTITIRSAAAAKTGARLRPLVGGASLASRDAAGEAAPGRRATVNESAAPSVETLDEIVVTGTHIRGVAAAGSNIISLDRMDIQKTGVATAQEIIKLLPQNFGGGANENTRIQFGAVDDPAALSNSTNASSVNLRGLGSGATLVLLNGRRFAPGGGSGLFVDVSSIPLSAVERIDVLPDGASAIYGSDAIGGVVNFVLRKDYSGAETSARVGSVTDGDASEYQVSQALGGSWPSGNGLVSYEFYKRDALPAAERAQAANSDLRSFGGGNFNSPNGNPGTITNFVDTWAIPPGQNGTSLQPADFVAGTRNLWNTRVGADIYGEQKKNSLLGTVTQNIGDNFQLFADGLFTRRDSDTRGPGLQLDLTVFPTNPFYVNPAGGSEPLSIQYNMFRDLGGANSRVRVDTYNTSVGVKVGGRTGWNVTAFGQYGREKQDVSTDDVSRVALRNALDDSNPATAFNPFGDGSFTNATTLASIRSSLSFGSTSDVKVLNLIADGPLWHVGGGDARLAIGVDRREHTFESNIHAPDNVSLQASYDRSVTAAFTELYVPLVGHANAMPGVQELELSLAARYEKYSDFGDTTNPKVGLRWSPLSSLGIRGTWGTSFKAPNLSDLDQTNNFAFIIPIPDSAAPPESFGLSPALIVQGGNPDLSEETADTWTAGIDFSPSALPGLKLALTYFSIEFTDRIAEPPFTGTWLDEPQFADIVFRDPTAEQRAFYCSKATFVDIGFGDCLTGDIAAIVDVRKNNTAIVETNGIDVLANYDFENTAGAFSTALNATYLRTFAQAQRPSSAVIDLIDTPNNPLKLKIRGSVSWARNSFGTTASLNFTDDYVDTITEPNRPIGSWTTLDFQFTYAWEADRTWLEGTTLALSVLNVFDKMPPFVNNPSGIGFDTTNADLRGRFAALTFRKKW